MAIVFAVTGYQAGDPDPSPTAQSVEASIDDTVTEGSPGIIRTPLLPGQVIETDYYRDDLGWIEEPDVLLAGLKEFYGQTGVQPYLMLSPPVSTTNTDEECDAYAGKLYDELFDDEGHLLLVYVENLDPDELGYLAYICGSDAVTVMDDPAVDILYRCIDRYWFDESYTTEEVFANAFRDTADDIMSQAVVPGTWKSTPGGWQFTGDDGKVLYDTWAEIDEMLYYFKPDGYMATGWFEHGGKWYYAHDNGNMATGWLEDNGKWYYLDESGASLTDTTTPDGYYLDEGGVWTP